MAVVVVALLAKQCGPELNVDNDGDSYYAQEDCDDEKTDVHPDAAEICDGIDNDCDGSIDNDDDNVTGQPDWYVDADRDQFGAVTTAASTKKSCTQPPDYARTADDCDDADVTINPSANEMCDGKDNNCDGATDEPGATDETTYYLDSDNDGFGDANFKVNSCDAMEGYVTNNDDWDDERADINPAAVEICDDVDNNQDGQIDEDVKTSFYPDADGDGFGTDPATEACAIPLGHTTVTGDCDDASPAINPNAEEICDTLDNNCDGATDEPGATGGTSYYLDNDSDGFGDPSTTTYACTIPTGYITDPTDCDDSNAEIHPGATDAALDNIDSNCDTELRGGKNSLETVASVILTGENAGDGAGISVSAIGSMVAVGAYKEDTAGIDAGAVYLVNGPASGEISLAAADGKILGEAAGDYAGWAVAPAGDVNGDGENDFLVGAYRHDTAFIDAGAAYILLGPVSGTLELKSAADAILEGESTYSYAGYAVAGNGDANGDSVPDILVGAPYAGSAQEGAVYLLHGPASSGSLNAANVKLSGVSTNDTPGVSVSLEDLDGDGLSDLVVGASGVGTLATNAGAVYINLSPAASSTLDLADVVLNGFEEDGYAGFSVAADGDLSADGYPDVVVGAYGVKNNTGHVYVVNGPVTTSKNLDSADATLAGVNAEDRAGMSVAHVGDFDGDGFGDLLVGAYNEDSNDFVDNGAVYLVYGPLAGVMTLVDLESTAHLTGKESGAYAGRSVAKAGDSDGDGFADILVGNYGANSGAGSAYLLLGGDY